MWYPALAQDTLSFMDASTEFYCHLGKLSSKPPSAEGENCSLTYSGLLVTETQLTLAYVEEGLHWGY